MDDTVRLQPGEVLVVRRWLEVFEKSDAKKYKVLTWVSVPVGFSSTGLQMLFDDFAPERAGLLFGAWSLLIKIAADGRQGERGRLCGSRGTAYSSAALSRMMMGIPVDVVDELISWCVHRAGWLEVIKVSDVADCPAGGQAAPQTESAGDSGSSAGDDRICSDSDGESERNQETSGSFFCASENLGESPSYRTEPNRTEHNHFRPAGTRGREDCFSFGEPTRELANSVAAAMRAAVGIRDGTTLTEPNRVAFWRVACWLAALPTELQAATLRDLTRSVRENRPKSLSGFLFAACRARDRSDDPRRFAIDWDMQIPPSRDTQPGLGCIAGGGG